MGEALALQQVTQGTLIVNFLRNTDKKGAADQTYDKLSARLSVLEDYWTKVMKNHVDLASHEQQLKDHVYFTEELLVTYEDAYITAKAELSRRMNALREPTVQEQAGRVLTPSSIPLPRLPLPTFSGKQNDWDSFKDRFCALVKNDPTLTPVTKLHRLITCLEGEAARRLKNLPLTSANFDVAWDNLVRRYDNKRVRLSSHLSVLMKMPAATRRSASEITRLLDEVNVAMRALRQLNRPVDHWDDWLIAIVESRLDSQTKEDWVKSLERDQGFPTYQDMVDFLEDRIRTLDATNSTDNLDQHGNFKKRNNQKTSKTVSAFHASPESTGEKTSGRSCVLCSDHHFIGYCPMFLKYTADKRMEFAEANALCYNCLRKGHIVAKCPSKSRCRTGNCKQAHHTLLHPDSSKSSQQAEAQSSQSTTNLHAMQVSLFIPISPGESSASHDPITILGTARVFVWSPAKTRLNIRALIDPGSESSFVSEKIVQALSLKRRRTDVAVTGVGGEVTATSKGLTEVTLSSTKQSNFSFSFKAFILYKLTSKLPRETLHRDQWPHLEGLDLADPDFYLPGGIDCILGGDVYPALMLEGIRKGNNQQPMAQDTVLGWIVTGPATPSQASRPSTMFSCCTSVQSNISEELRRFWEVEDVSVKQILSDEDAACEDHFARTHRRDSTGRYIVRLPFSKSPSFPASGKIALSRFLQTERRLQAKPELRTAYTKFMSEYLTLGHMERVSKDSETKDEAFYLPHHAVFKQDGSNKIRVVFNASQPALNGISLNDCLHTGPKLQSQIHIVLTRWRFPRFVFTADIVKMFRQFLVDKDDADWQRIYWRNRPDEMVQIMRLVTVTYGTACAPYLAIRVLQQLAQDERSTYPRGSAILEENLYVDDALAGEDTLEAALEARDQLIGILQTAGMQLDKWSANCAALTEDFTSVSSSDRSFDETDAVSTLGLRWHPTHDHFFFKVRLPKAPQNVTKRSMLSEVAHLFDPLGWLAPVVIKAKMLIQRLWLTGADWDQAVDDDTLASWSELRSQLPDLERIRIPRWLGASRSTQWFLHGFADASQQAYAVAIYAVVLREDQSSSAMLLSAKTKVAPIKTISVPRLELCAASLLVKLVLSYKPFLHPPPAGIYCWSDSQVTLAWLAGHPSRWTTFVANRVSEIRTSLPEARWSHVRSAENPADLATRGTLPKQLETDSLWWHGPEWLTYSWERWTTSDVFITDLEQRRQQHTFAARTHEESYPFETIIAKFSNLPHLLRVFGYILRWRFNARKVSAERSTGPLRGEEVELARTYLIRATQIELFSLDRARLNDSKSLPTSSPIGRLLPFLDEQGVMRVGGRLQNAFLSFSEKHPAIIPSNSHLAELLIRDAHLRTLHGGPQLVTSWLLREYWIPRARNRVRFLTRQCIRCTRFRGQRQCQQMAPLPIERVTPSRPFTTTGLDYAGPFLMRTSKGRGQKAYKGYVALFVCMATRAIHIEVVSDYSTPTFLLAFRRFTSRRGLPHTVYSDNGTTFQGAQREIQRLFDATSEISRDIAAAVASDGVNWNFIPPHAPHFGGLWEAGVKAFKHHFRRVLGDAKLTFEEMSTLVTHIEACLNSRPLSPLSSDPEDISALTPGHFLIGAALTSLPEPNTPDFSLTGGARYQHLLQMRNHFWTRWQKEVLHNLQQRTKWLQPNDTIHEGDLVLLTDDLQPPTKWPLARVEICHPGTDGLTRVVTLRTANSTLRRPLVKIIKLPVESQDSSNSATRVDTQRIATAGGCVTAGECATETTSSEGSPSINS